LSLRTRKVSEGVVVAFDVGGAEELRQALPELKERFNKYWVLQRYRYATPEQV